jgi:hypothetical protein
MQVLCLRGRLVKISDDPAPAIRITTLISAGVALSTYVRAGNTTSYPKWSEGPCGGVWILMLLYDLVFNVPTGSSFLR